MKYNPANIPVSVGNYSKQYPNNHSITISISNHTILHERIHKNNNRITSFGIQSIKRFKNKKKYINEI